MPKSVIINEWLLKRHWEKLNDKRSEEEKESNNAHETFSTEAEKLKMTSQSEDVMKINVFN